MLDPYPFLPKPAPKPAKRPAVIVDDDAATAEVRVVIPAIMPRGSGAIFSAGKPTILNDRYELRRRIGVGGMGHVYLAVDRLLEREVAVKIMRGDLANQQSHVERFRREAQLLARVESARVIQIYDMHFGDDLCYLVMRHVAGRTLNRIVDANGPLEHGAALELALDLLEGLAALHAEGLVHRDVKPSNVLVDLDGRAVLLDLGVAIDRRRPAVTPSHMTAGTLAYMAPEQKLTGHADGRSDVYQVGLLLLYAVLGIDASEHGFERGVRDTLMMLPGPLADLIARALEEDPERRFQTASEMSAAVLRALDAPDVVDLHLDDSAEEDLGLREDEVILLDRKIEPIGESQVIEIARPPKARPHTAHAQRARRLPALLVAASAALIAGLIAAAQVQADDVGAAATAGPVAAPVSEIDPAAIDIDPVRIVHGDDAAASPQAVHASARADNSRPAQLTAKSVAPSGQPAADLPDLPSNHPLLRSAAAAERAGADESAITALRQYLITVPDAADADAVRMHLRALSTRVP